MPVTITPFTHTPSRQNPSTFSEDMDYRLSEENSRITEMNLQSAENNAINANVNAKEASAVAASVAAVSAANFKGTWTNQLTSIGESWLYNGVIYGVLVAGTASPDTTPSNWFALSLASSIQNTPSGGISATTVQGALNELDTEKAPLSSPSFTGSPTAPTPADGDNDTSIATTEFIVKAIPYNIANATSKTTPVDADLIGIVDSAASNVLKKLTWANVNAKILSSFGVMISTAVAKTVPVDADIFIIGDSAATNASKKLTWANLKATLFASPSFSGKIISSDSTVSVSSGVYSSSTNVATVVLTVASHSVSVGDIIRVSGITNTQASTSGSNIVFNGYQTVTAQTPTTITYTIDTLLGTVSSTALTGTISFTSGGLYLDSMPKVKSGDNYYHIQGATAWVNFDGVTTPPTIRDSFNVSAVVRTATGEYDIYFKTPMDTINYSSTYGAGYNNAIDISIREYNNARSVNKAHFAVAGNTTNTLQNANNIDITIFGGKNQ